MDVHEKHDAAADIVEVVSRVMRYSAGAVAVINALKGLEDQRETIWADRALLVLSDLSPVESMVARALRSRSVWDETMRRQLREGASGKPGTEHLRPRSLSGFTLPILLAEAERIAADDSKVGERHLTTAMAVMLRDDLRAWGIDPERFVAEVTNLERRLEEAEPMTHSWPRFVKPQEDTRQAAVRRLGLEGLHPTILAAASDLFTDGHYAQAIFEAFKAVEVRVRQTTGIQASGRHLMSKAFGGKAPTIRVTSEQGQIGQDEQEGFTLLFMGAMQGIRNPKAHEAVVQTDPQRTLEYLAFASLLMRRLDDARNS